MAAPALKHSPFRGSACTLPPSTSLYTVLVLLLEDGNVKIVPCLRSSHNGSLDSPGAPVPRKLVGLFESQQSPTLRPGPEWKGAFDEAPQLLLQLYGALGQDPELAHVALQCLLQLATLNGALVGERDQRGTHLGRFLGGGLLDLMGARPPREGVAQLVGRLALFHPPSLLGPDLLGPYLERLCALAEALLQPQVGTYVRRATVGTSRLPIYRIELCASLCVR